MFKSKQKKINNLLKQAYHQIKLKKFNQSIETYNKILHEYRASNQNKIKLKNDIKILYKELNLYLSVNQAYIISQNGDFTGFENQIKKIHDLVYDLQNEEHEQITGYKSVQNKFLLEVYPYQMNKNQFESKCNKAKKLLENSLDESMKEFSQLLIVSNKLVTKLDLGEKEKVYGQLKALYKEISIKKLFAMSREKYKKVPNIKEYKIKIRQKNIEPKPKAELGTSFKELHDNIKQTDYSKVISVYEKL